MLAACSSAPLDPGDEKGSSSSVPSTQAQSPQDAAPAGPGPFTGEYQPPSLEGLDLLSTPVYAALGDSVSSGVGAGRLGFCGRASGSWVEIAAVRDGAVFLNYACSGSGLDGLEAQAAALDDEVDVVGLTFLGNDADLTGVIRGCLSGACTDTVASSLEKVSGLLPRAESILRRIAAGRRVVVSGYVPAFSPEFVCAAGATMDASEVLMEAQNSLAAMQRRLVENLASEGFDIVFVMPSFGHEMCSPDPWVHDFFSVLAVHPNPAGYQAMSELLEPGSTRDR